MRGFEPISGDAEEPVSIIIVDDRSADRLALCEVLSGTGTDVVAVGSGVEALRELEHREFAVILLDLVMPAMDGFELATLIKRTECNRHTPIVFLTASEADIGKVYRAYALGAVDYLNKPIDADIVRAKVSIFVELLRKDRRIRRQAAALRAAESRERDLQMAEVRLMGQRRYVNLAEAIPQIVWTSDANGSMNYANRRWVEYTGMELERASGSGWLEAIHPDDVENCVQAWKKALSSGGAYEVECRIRQAQGATYRWHLCRAVPEFDEQGQIVAWLGTYTDFEAVKQAMQARDEFMSIASHELRTPLTALKLRLEALAYWGELQGKARLRLEGAIRQSQRLESLIENLLDVSRITWGRLELHPEATELLQLTTQVVHRLLPEAQARGSHIELSRTKPTHGLWDRRRIEQVLMQLLSNAIKFGEGRPINVRIASDDDYAQVTVADRGVGIAPSELSRIFDRFERGSNCRGPGGLGMGLYVAHQFVLAHGGSIQVESKLGAGTTFILRLPSDGSKSAAGIRTRT